MKAKRLIPPFLLLLTLSGCSGRSEVRDKGFIRTIGADCNDVQTISLQLYGSDEVLTGQGTTLFSAIAIQKELREKICLPDIWSCLPQVRKIYIKT